jgi:hypothetical protein
MWHWDLWTATAGAVVFSIIALAAGDYRGSQPMLIAAVPTNLTISVAVWLGGRWVADRLRTEDYGELVRLVDPREEAISLPYQVVAFIAILGALASGVAAGTLGELAIVPTVIFHAGTLFLTLWAALGLGSLIALTFRHQRRIAEIQSLKEEVEYLQRDEGAGPDRG